MTEWKPIETAPSGDYEICIDMWAGDVRFPDCYWGKPTYGGKTAAYGWVYQSGYDSDGPVSDYVPSPSHWMPLPEPPSQRVDSVNALATGWPTCCGYTMTIDSPDERAALRASGNGLILPNHVTGKV